MNDRNDFNVSANSTEKQKSQHEEQQRQLAERKRGADVQRIQDDKVQREIRTKLNERDVRVKELSDENKRKIKDETVKRFEKEGSPKQEYIPPPPIGAAPLTPNQRFNHIETQVRNSLGVKLEQEGRQVESGLNRQIDEAVKNQLEKERVTSRSASREETQQAKRQEEPEQKKGHSWQRPASPEREAGSWGRGDAGKEFRRGHDNENDRGRKP